MNLNSSLRSLCSRRRRSLIAAVIGVLCVWILVTRNRGNGTVLPPEPDAAAIVIAPRMPSRMVFRPLFRTPDHEFEAGAAFLARIPTCPDPILFTALQNIGPAGGYYTQAVGDRLEDTVSGIELREAYSGEKVLSPEIEPLRVSGTAPLGSPSESGDVAAFRARGSRHLDSGLLSEESTPPLPGSHVWLGFGQPSTVGAEGLPAVSSAPPGPKPPRIHHGLVTDLRDGLLYYALDDPDVPLRGSAGAPVLAEGGRVVGIHLGSATENGRVFGIATPVSRFLPALRDACRPAPQTASAVGTRQN